MSESTSISRRTAVGAAAMGALALAVQPGAEGKDKPHGLIEPLLAVLRAHDKAYLGHDAQGVLATMTDDVFLLGTGPAEIWKGKKEVGAAYEHFFQDFEKNTESFEPEWVEGGIDGTLGLVAATTNVKVNKTGKAGSFGMNVSIAFANVGGKWLIKAMHYSTAAPHKA